MQTTSAVSGLRVLVGEPSRSLPARADRRALAWVRVKAKYARHLRRDYRAVELAIETPWSNGPVEGQINRLKAIKRQMYGRAGFDLT
jgi:transposase